MGWRAWDAYDREAHERWKALPWRERYSWRVILRLALFALIVAIFATLIYRSAHAQEGGARAEDLTGIPRIIDGDTVAIDGVKVRLQGIDAPETEQFCLDNKGQPAHCGEGVRDRLKEKSAGRPWTCKVQGKDIYSRSLARCYIGGEDIQKWLVRSGFALAYKHYSHDYDADEQAAREAHAGLWSGAFIAPWDWRHRNTSTEILGAVSVPIDAQKILLRPTVAAPKATTTAPKVNTAHSHGGCGSRGGPGYRLANGKCASWHKRRSHSH